MEKTPLVVIAIAIIFSIGYIFINSENSSNRNVSQNSEIKDGIQYITINAKGGYAPKISEAKAGIPTKLIMKTNGTYDCSASLAIRSIGYQNVLPQTGKTEIDIGTPRSGGVLKGVCSMGMYSFQVRFSE